MSSVAYHYKPQGPTLDAYLRNRDQRCFIMGPVGCLPGDSEFLTPDGWKRMDSHQPGDQVAVWSEEGRVSFESAEHVRYAMIPGEEFIRFGSGSLVMELSQEHRVPYFDYRGKFKVTTAGEMAARPSIRHIPTTWTMDRPDAPISDAEIRMRVMVAADGNYPKAGKQCFVCVRKPRKVERVRDLLVQCGVAFDERVAESRPTEHRFVFSRPVWAKSLSFVWGLSSRQLGVVLEEAMLWDGLANHEERRFFTTKPEWADAIQFAAHATGVRATIRSRQDTRQEADHWRPSISVYIRNHGSAKNGANVRSETPISRFTATDGEKYCFHTSTGFFVARCQGTVFITGNSGKTSASCWKAFRVMVDQAPQRDKVRRTRILAVRNTYNDLFSTTIKDWLEMFAPLGRFVGGSQQAPTHYIDFDLPDGTRVLSEMIFLALDSPDDVRKLRGTQLTAAWLNEAKELPFGIFEMMDLRIGRYPKVADGGATWSGIFGDTNAADTDHWYYRMAEEDKPEGWKFLRQPGGLIRASATSPWRPNPRAENLRNLKGGSEYYLKGAQGKGDDWIAVNLANEYGFVKNGKPVYPDFRDAVMVRDFELVKELGIGVGVDFGLFPAAAFGQRAISGQWRIRRELCAEDVGTQRFAGEIKRVLDTHYSGWPINGIWGDPAGGQRAAGDVNERTAFQLMAAVGVEATPACTDNDITMRVEAFSAPMRKLIDGEPGILIHSDCKRLRKGCQGGYAYRRVKVVGEERYRDMPNKDMYSHIADAGQYLLLGGGESVRVVGGSANKTTDIDEFKALMGYT